SGGHVLNTSPSLTASCRFFLRDPPPPEIYPLSLHDALPILAVSAYGLSFYLGKLVVPVNLSPLYELPPTVNPGALPFVERREVQDRKSTRLNSSHVAISYAVFCLKKKKMI